MSSGARLFASERAARSSSGQGHAGGDDFFDGIAGLLEGVDGGFNANLFAFEILNEVGADWSQASCLLCQAGQHRSDRRCAEPGIK